MATYVPMSQSDSRPLWLQSVGSFSLFAEGVVSLKARRFRTLRQFRKTRMHGGQDSELIALKCKIPLHFRLRTRRHDEPFCPSVDQVSVLSDLYFTSDFHCRPVQTVAHEIILTSPSICDWETFGTVGAIPTSARLTSTCISVSLSFNAPDTMLMVNLAYTLLHSSRWWVGMVKISESPLFSKVQCGGTVSAVSSWVDECAKPQYFITLRPSMWHGFGHTLGKSLMMLLPITEAAAGNMLKSLQYLVYLSCISAMTILSQSWAGVRLNANLK